jgi:hypothetical protein
MLQKMVVGEGNYRVLDYYQVCQVLETAFKQGGIRFEKVLR